MSKPSKRGRESGPTAVVAQPAPQTTVEVMEPETARPAKAAAAGALLLPVPRPFQPSANMAVVPRYQAPVPTVVNSLWPTTAYRLELTADQMLALQTTRPTGVRFMYKALKGNQQMPHAINGTMIGAPWEVTGQLTLTSCLGPWGGVGSQSAFCGLPKDARYSFHVEQPSDGLVDRWQLALGTLCSEYAQYLHFDKMQMGLSIMIARLRKLQQEFDDFQRGKEEVYRRIAEDIWSVGQEPGVWDFCERGASADAVKSRFTGPHRTTDKRTAFHVNRRIARGSRMPQEEKGAGERTYYEIPNGASFHEMGQLAAAGKVAITPFEVSFFDGRVTTDVLALPGHPDMYYSGCMGFPIFMLPSTRGSVLRNPPPDDLDPIDEQRRAHASVAFDWTAKEADRSAQRREAYGRVKHPAKLTFPLLLEDAICGAKITPTQVTTTQAKAEGANGNRLAFAYVGSGIAMICPGPEVFVAMFREIIARANEIVAHNLDESAEFAKPFIFNGRFEGQQAELPLLRIQWMDVDIANRALACARSASVPARGAADPA